MPKSAGKSFTKVKICILFSISHHAILLIRRFDFLAVNEVK